MNQLTEEMSQTLASTYLKNLAEKSGVKISDEKIKEVSEKITEALTPYIERGIKEPIEKGFLIDSLNEIK